MLYINVKKLLNENDNKKNNEILARLPFVFKQK